MNFLFFFYIRKDVIYYKLMDYLQIYSCFYPLMRTTYFLSTLFLSHPTNDTLKVAINSQNVLIENKKDK